MGISNKFRFGTIAGIKSGFIFRSNNIYQFPFFNHLKNCPDLPEAITIIINHKIK